MDQEKGSDIFSILRSEIKYAHIRLIAIIRSKSHCTFVWLPKWPVHNRRGVVAMQVIARKVGPRPVVAPLEERPVILHVVGVDRAPDILVQVIHRLMHVVRAESPIEIGRASCRERV